VARTPRSRTPRSRTPRSRDSLIRALGISGWDAADAVVLAALATEAPLLLIGPHGSAKSLLLTRLAAALGLAHRHYNASLLSFDDLVGFPVPQGDRLVYLQTPATIWDAEAVFFDEVSRCRPELQNKLFPIVYERLVQGVPLAKLRYRWAAMNPPPADDAEGASYAGSEPLDIALADRFAFIVEAPAFGDLSAADQAQVVRRGGAPDGDAGERLVRTVEQTRACLAGAGDALAGPIADYVPLVAQKLAAAGHPLSTRRAVQLGRNIESVAAAMRVLGIDAKADAPYWNGLRHSIPDAAWGQPVPGAQLLGAHRAAWEIARLDDQPELKALLSERDPMKRIARAVGATTVPPLETGKIVADSFAALSRVERLATARAVMARVGRRSDLPGSCLELVALTYAELAQHGTSSVTVSRGGNDWKRDILSSSLATLDRGTLRGRVLTNAAIALMRGDERFAFADLARAYDTAAACLHDDRDDAEASR
jgi:MoxR-like ATPase